MTMALPEQPAREQEGTPAAHTPRGDQPFTSFSIQLEKGLYRCHIRLGTSPVTKIDDLHYASEMVWEQLSKISTD